MKRSVMLVLLPLLLFSCGGNGDDRADTNGGGDSPATTAADEPAGELEGKLLTLSDLPAGYTPSEAGDNDSADFCNGDFNILERFPPEQQAEVEFQKQTDEPLAVSVIAQLLAEYSTQDAEEAFSRTQAAIETCKSYEETDPEDGTKTSGTVAPLSFPDLGDETLAIKVDGEVTVQGSPLPFQLEVALVREGSTIMGVANIGVGRAPVDTQMTAEIAETAYQKLI